MSWELLGWLASAVFFARLLPQPLKLARTGVAEGVSALSALNSVLSALAWLVHGLAVGLAPVWAVAAAAIPPGLWTIALLRHQVTRRDLAHASLWLGAIVVGIATGQIGVILAFSVVVNQGPQVLDALRNDDLSGISVSTWWIAIADAVLWGAYGVGMGDTAVMGYSVVLLGVTAIVMGRVFATSDRRADSVRTAFVPAPALSPSPALLSMELAEATDLDA
jgi:uncharacterized protein with PQ loop repeat